MTDHHPAIAEQIAEHEALITGYIQAVERLQGEISVLQDDIARHRGIVAAYIDAEQRLLAALRPDGAALHARIAATFGEAIAMPASAAPPQPAPPASKRVKRDVRGAVMACFAGEGNHSLSESFVVERTGLPESSVRPYLLRAVRGGELEREGDLYRRPQIMDDTIDDEKPIDEGATAEQWQEEVNMMAAEGTPWPPRPEKIVETIRGAGDWGMSREQLAIIGATDTQIAFLKDGGEIEEGGDRRYRIAEDRGKATT